VFGVDCYVSDVKEAAAKGGALLARWAVSGGERKPEELGAELRLVATPRAEMVGVYEKLAAVYKLCEEQVLEMCSKNET